MKRQATDGPNSSLLTSKFALIDESRGHIKHIEEQSRELIIFLGTIQNGAELLNAVINAANTLHLEDPMEITEDVLEKLRKLFEIMRAIRKKLEETLDTMVPKEKQLLKESLDSLLRDKRESTRDELRIIIEKWAKENKVDLIYEDDETDSDMVDNISAGDYTISVTVSGSILENLACYIKKTATVRVKNGATVAQ